MTINLHPKTAHDSLSLPTTTALRVVVALSLAAACVMALAETDAESDLQSLESTFWVCDHAASTRGYGTTEGMACSVTYEALKQRKFDGSFEAFLAWWQQHKLAMHDTLEGTESSAALEEDFPTP